MQSHHYPEHSTELDSHADTCVVGKNCLITHTYDKTVSVTGYDPKMGTTRGIQVVSAALAYDDPHSGETVILRVHQAVHIPTMLNNLLCPMQMRLNDVVVEDCPKFLHPNPTETTHSIAVREEDDTLVIPLSIRGVTSYFPTRIPTHHENETCRAFNLTFEDPTWNPASDSFALQEEAQVDPHGRIREPGDRPSRYFISGLVSGYGSQTPSSYEMQCAAVLMDIEPYLVDTLFARMLKENVQVNSTTTSRRKGFLTAERLAKNWSISIEAAKQTLQVTTQRGIRTVANPMLSRRFRTNDRQMRYRRIRADVFTDTLESAVRSKRGNKFAQVFATNFGWTRVHPMAKKSNAHDGLSLLFARDGVPNCLIMDNSKEQTMGDFRKKARQADCWIKQTEVYTPWSNYAELAIRELKKGCARKMIRARAPKRLWDECLEMEAYIRSNTVSGHPLLNGETPETVVSGETADISEFAEHAFYDWVKYRDTIVAYPEDKLVLGRYLGPSIDIGPAMTAKILKDTGFVTNRSTFRALTQDEWDDPAEKEARQAFDRKIAETFGDQSKPDDFGEDLDLGEAQLYEDDDVQEQNKGTPDRDDLPDDYYDQYLNAEVLLPKGDQMMTGKVKRRKVDGLGVAIGHRHDNPILDTRTYMVEFPDGAEMEYTTNTIAENMWAQCDIDGNQWLLMEAIIDHRSDETAIPKDKAFITVNNRKQRVKTTKGWELCIQWKDGTTTWQRLADMKESNPVEVSEYAVAKELDDEPAFAWWVDWTLKRRNRIIAAVNNRTLKRTHKFGIPVPRNADEAYRFDKENGNTFWADAIDKEMKNVRIAFQILDDGSAAPVGYQFIRCHGIFDIKMDSFQRKYRMVAGGHMTEAPATLTYASVVSRESVRIALMLAALNDLQVKAADIQNAYLTAPVSEKIWTTLGAEFGNDAGRKAIIVRALYGLKSAGASFRNHLATCMKQLGYTSCMADPDVWYRAETRPEDSFKYYAYVLLYVDDILAVHHDGVAAIREIDKYFKMKPGSIGDPDIYLGAKLRQIQLPNGVHAWSLSASKYVQEAVRNVKDYFKRERPGQSWPKRASTPFQHEYRPEVDITKELNDDEASFFQSQVGVLRWMVEIGRVDIITEVSMLASCMAAPRDGHLEAVFRLFAYLEKKHNSRVVFDPTYPNIDMSQFKDCDWKEFYVEAEEAIPPNAPVARGKEVDIRLYVDSDHAGDRATRRSRTGFLVYLNSALTAWYSKRQPTVESSVFGAEFVALKNGMEAVRGLRYKLRMMGVEISGPTYTYGDNMSVIHNTQRPESTLKKKSNSICYHACREAVAMGEMLTTHIPTALNPADLATKIIPGGIKRDSLLNMILYDIVAVMTNSTPALKRVIRVSPHQN